MNRLTSYLIEEATLDVACGRLSRREALARFLAVGVGAAAAAALLVGCRRGTHVAVEATVPVSDGVGPAPLIEFMGPAGSKRLAAFAAAEQPRGAVLVIHGGPGLTDPVRRFVTRLAERGYTSLCVDLLSEEGGTAGLREDQVFAALGNASDERIHADLRAGIDELLRRAPRQRVGVIGFCMGGGLTWDLLALDERIAAAIPFYGPAPAQADLSRATAAVLVLYAETDPMVNPTMDAARNLLERRGLAHRMITYPGTQHAFMDESSESHDAAAAAAAWGDAVAWLDTHLATA